VKCGRSVVLRCNMEGVTVQPAASASRRNGTHVLQTAACRQVFPELRAPGVFRSGSLRQGDEAPQAAHAAEGHRPRMLVTSA